MDNITCPFCGLACDDLQVDAAAGSIRIGPSACATSREAYGRLADSSASPRVDGAPATLDAAYARAAAILGRARNPLFGGLATDLTGARAVTQLADRVGATLDHMNAAAKFRNVFVMQDGGWIATTLAEVKNRADLIVLAGTDVVSRFPRFFERFVWNAESMFELNTAAREIVYLGQGLDTRAGHAPDGRTPLQLNCSIDHLGEAFGAMRALLAGAALSVDEVAGVPLAAWADLVGKLRKARYAVIVWAAPDLDFPHAELAVAALAKLIGDLNRETRVSALPLGGTNGDYTANGVMLWQTGFPIRTSFATGEAVHEPHLFQTAHLIESGEADALLWVSAFDPTRVPPATSVPTIVLAPPSATFEREPEVFIPVGTPGVDHAGHVFRTDKVVSMPLRKLRDTTLPSVADALAAIEAALQSGVV